MNLEQIVISALDAEINQYEATLAALPEPSYSLKHRRVMEKAIRTANKEIKISEKPHQQTHHVRIRRIVVAALVAVLIMVSSVIAFAAVYPEYYRVIKEKVKEWTITFVTDGEDNVLTEFVVKKGAVPEDFDLTNEVSEDGVYIATYDRHEAEEEITYVQEALSKYSITGIDSENDYKKIEEINGIKTIVMKKNDCYTLFWVKDSCSYTLVGNCNLDVLKAYAESLE